VSRGVHPSTNKVLVQLLITGRTNWSTRSNRSVFSGRDACHVNTARARRTESRKDRGRLSVRQYS
jgi:hypothetical protein